MQVCSTCKPLVFPMQGLEFQGEDAKGGCMVLVFEVAETICSILSLNYH